MNILNSLQEAIYKRIECCLGNGMELLSASLVIAVYTVVNHDSTDSFSQSVVTLINHTRIFNQFSVN